MRVLVEMCGNRLLRAGSDTLPDVAGLRGPCLATNNEQLQGSRSRYEGSGSASMMFCSAFDTLSPIRVMMAISVIMNDAITSA